MRVSARAGAALLVLAQVLLHGCSSGTTTSSGAIARNTLAPGTISFSPSATSIVATPTTASTGTTSLACGTSPGRYDEAAVDNGLPTSEPHESIVAGLLPSTTYYCQMSFPDTGTSVTFTATTTALAASTPITGLSFGSISTYNSLDANNRMEGDTFYNCKSNDGATYLTTDDTHGWQESGSPGSQSSALSLVKFTAEAPLAGITVNPLTAYGPAGTATGEDQRSEKDAGLFCMAGNLFMTIGRQMNQATGGMGSNTAYVQDAGQVIWSADKGISWNDFQNPQSSSSDGSPTSPESATMFGSLPGNMGSATFVMYCGDDGTLGYLDPCNRTDNADAYIYLVANDGYWDSGNVLFLARVPRAKISRLQASDYEFYTGGDGSLDTSWTSAQSDAQPVIANRGKLGEPNVQYLPALNRYLLLTYSYPQGLAPGAVHSEHTLWLGYEAPHPWGPWTLINSTDWPTQGYYNPVILNDTATAGTSPVIMFTGDFFGSGTYQMYLTTMSVLH
jgi:hypothetical protein